MDLKVTALDREYAKVPMKTLVQWAMEGRIAPGDLVRASGTADWLGVSQVPELAASMPRGLAREPSLDGEDDPELDADAASQWVAKRPRHRSEEAEMDMTPMIDVTFQLLIFFMLTNVAAHPSPMLVPEAVHGRGVDPEGHQMILIDENGGYYLGDRAEPQNISDSLDALVSEVAGNIGGAEQPVEVIVNAHKEARYVQVRELVERLGNVPNVGEVKLGVEEKR
jgi:biopolymer transport protein ExbD